ncbi:NAD-dependent epimerase/dehydratase family protein [uncultured Roseovarius sp.]|uniref:NAD-dependent epimerase/dehydratase family protein n=1 Tax=uncultured Roseovarius sp. TaxID=293344 RepID=UPI0025D39F05|nr:NAD-dependent epimerase/dehydratase family protein [uncultured Roseovarius sp.]
MTQPIILGATGQVGQALARVWPAAAPRGIWQYRPGADRRTVAGFPGTAFSWDILAEPAPDLPPGASGMIVLAGVTGHDAKALARNTDIAVAAVRAARAAGISRVLVASTQAVYGTGAARVSEADPCVPTAPYGRAKLEMEVALAACPEVTCLRLGNVAGTDTLFRTAARHPVTLDRFADGTSPRRSYIGPVTLADVLLGLLDPGLGLPRVLNVANPGVLAMDDVLKAASLEFTYRAAPPDALALLELDVTRLSGLVALPSADPDRLIAEARKGGWQPGGKRERGITPF